MSASTEPQLSPGHTGRERRAGREALLFAGLFALVAGVALWQGPAFGLRMTAEAACYALLALGLTIQWGYAGLFNAGIMGFVALGGFMLVFWSAPPEPEFWESDLPGRLGTAVAVLIGAIGAFILALRAPVARGWIATAVGVVGYIVVMRVFTPVAEAIEDGPGFIGGMGLPAGVGWLMGGALAAAVAWGVGKICLGLRSDYLAIATLGVAEIVKAVLKNADWLTRGTLTVSPLPWPTPTPNDIGFIAARAGYLCVTAVLIALAFLALQRAYHAPWGRMVRAIRDNEQAAAAMGKDVDARRLQIFILGSALMGVAGAALVGFNRTFDPSGFLPLQHTFLVWVMVILGGAGNNLGAVFGAVLVYIVWTLSEPAALALFALAETQGAALLGWEPPADLAARALQFRVFLIGLAIVLVLRFAPEGVFPQEADRRDA